MDSVEKFLEYSDMYYKYTKFQDIESANKYAKKLYNILKSIKNMEVRNSFFDEILKCQNNTAKIWVCGSCVDSDYKKKDAYSILENLSHCEDEIIARNAEMALFVRKTLKSN